MFFSSETKKKITRRFPAKQIRIFFLQFLLKFLDEKTVGSGYLFSCIFQVNLFFSIKFGNKKNSTAPPLEVKWSFLTMKLCKDFFTVM